MSDDSFDSEALSGESVEDTRQTDEEKGKNKNEEENDPLKNNLDLIKSISSALTTILEENKKLDNYKEIIKKQSKMVFSANSIPNISIKDYLIRIQTYSGIEKSTLILSLILIDHICKKSDLILTYFNIHRVLFGSILISIKFNEDSYYDNKFYAEIAGVKLKELKLIEESFFQLNDFNVYVDFQEYEQYTKYLENFNEISKESKK
jgi:DNA-directed RNA polymerase subunit L